MYTPLPGPALEITYIRGDGETLGCWDQAMYTLLLGPALVRTYVRGDGETLGSWDQVRYTLLLGPSLRKTICHRGLLDTRLLGPGNVHSIAGTNP